MFETEESLYILFFWGGEEPELTHKLVSPFFLSQNMFGMFINSGITILGYSENSQ